MADALYQSKLIGSVFFVISHGAFFSSLFLTTVRSWEMQFLTDKLIVFPSHSEDHKIHKLLQTPLSFLRLSRS